MSTSHLLMLSITWREQTRKVNHEKKKMRWHKKNKRQRGTSEEITQQKYPLIDKEGITI